MNDLEDPDKREQMLDLAVADLNANLRILIKAMQDGVDGDASRNIERMVLLNTAQIAVLLVAERAAVKGA